MFKYLWNTAIVSAVGLTLLVTPGISEAQRRGGNAGGRGGSPQTSTGSRGVQNNGGRVENRNGNNNWNNQGYYRGYGGYGGWGFGWGYPGYYYGGRPYY